MKNTIYCKNYGRDGLAFYLKCNGKNYYLFTQAYTVSVRDYFWQGADVNDCLDMTKAKNKGASVKHVFDKLKIYIPYIEKEHGLTVLKKTAKKKSGFKKGYKRKKINLSELEFAI
jgi:hypothetical protein